MIPQRFHLRDAMLLITGLAVSLWLVVPIVRSGPDNDVGGKVFLSLVMMLGGLSLWGPPLLLTEIRSRRRPWGPGKVFWFATGTAPWLMWPPIVVRRVSQAGNSTELGTSGICFAYGTPLMAVYVTAALLAGGWLRRRRRRRRRQPLSWREQFGLALGVVWACTGLYVLYLIYADKLR